MIPIKEKILLNHSVPDTIVAQIAEKETGKLIDIVLNNQVRLIRDPLILASLERTGWNFGEACSILGISRPTLRRKIARYELRR